MERVVQTRGKKTMIGLRAGPLGLAGWCLLAWVSFWRPLSADSQLFLSDDVYFVIWTMDAGSGDIVRGFSAPRDAIGITVPRGRSGLALDGGEVFYTHSSSDQIYVLDSFSGEVRRTLPKPSTNISGLDAGGGKLFAVTSSRTGAAVYQLDPSTGAVLNQKLLPGARDALAYSAARGSLFVRIGSLEIREIDAQTGASRRSLSPPAEFSGLAFSDVTGLLYGMTEEGALYDLNPDTGAVTRKLQVKDSSGNELRQCGGLAAGQVAPPPGAGPQQARSRSLDSRLRVSDATLMPGEVQAVPILLSTAREAQGFSVALIHDPGILALDGITVGSTATSQFQADFVAAEVFLNGGTLGVVFDLLPPLQNNVLPPGQNQLVAYCQYRCPAPDLLASVTTEVRLVDGVLGSPPKTNLTVFAGEGFSPQVIPGKITLLAQVAPGGPEFFCGGLLGSDGLPTPLAARSGESVELCFFYTFPEPHGSLIQGLSMALTYDCRLSCLESSFHLPPDSITQILNADFVDFQCDNSSTDGDGCEMVLGILIDSLPPFNGASLPATSFPLLLGCVQMEIGGGVETNECLPIRFRDGINGRGVIPIQNLVALENQSITPVAHPCEVCVTATGPSLYCGADTLDAAGRPEAVPGDPDGNVKLCLWYSSPGAEVRGLTQAIRFDCRLACLESSLQLSPEASALLTPDQVKFQCENDPGDGDGCELVLQILPSTNPSKVLPATNRPRDIGCVTFRIARDAPRGFCLPVEYHDGTNGRGTELFSNQVLLASGPVSPQTFDCRICVRPTERPKFYCGGPTLGSDGRPVPVADVPRGGMAELCFWYSSFIDEFSTSDEIQGLSMALCFDCNMKCHEESFRVPPDSITALVHAEFVDFNCDNDPNDGDGCEMVLGLLVDASPPFDGRTLPPTTTPLKIACVDMELGPGPRPGACLNISFCDGVNGRGNVPIRNLVSIGSQSARPITFDCPICVKRLGPEFFCGAGTLGPDGLPAAVQGTAGKPAELCFWYSSPEDGSPEQAQFDHLQGLSMALSFDCHLQCLEDSFRVPPDSITAALGAEFVEFQCDNNPLDGDGCEMVLSILVDALPPFDGRTLPPTNVPLKLACVDVLLPDKAACGQCFAIHFQDGVNGRGKVPISNLVATENQSFLVLTNDCKACVNAVKEPTFQRGDCNFDDEVNISDAAEIVSFLFGVGSWKPLPRCLDACDANDDGRVDLADANQVLLFLFRLGGAPPPPGPFVPGPDPTPDKIDCKIDTCE